LGPALFSFHELLAELPHGFEPIVSPAPQLQVFGGGLASLRNGRDVVELDEISFAASVAFASYESALPSIALPYRPSYVRRDAPG